ncbi:hypothetical protein [Priestia koreensis]|uniref:hypothetical protein n=1 Tax=Priestia koreensis TaxID=284581 RepID=UPI0012EE0772|nr:hypothetical protein [Priestia koreensis]
MFIVLFQYIEAIGYKNEHGMWNIFLADVSEDTIALPESVLQKDPNFPLLFPVKLRADGEGKLKHFAIRGVLRLKESGLNNDKIDN